MNSKHLKKIIDKQFKICGLNLKFEDVCGDKTPKWFKKSTCSSEQNEKWKNWTMKYMREKMKLTKDKAFIETAWVNLNYGLRVVNEKTKNKKAGMM